LQFILSVYDAYMLHWGGEILGLTHQTFASSAGQSSRSCWGHAQFLLHWIRSILLVFYSGSLFGNWKVLNPRMV